METWNSKTLFEDPQMIRSWYSDYVEQNHFSFHVSFPPVTSNVDCLPHSYTYHAHRTLRLKHKENEATYCTYDHVHTIMYVSAGPSA